MSTSHRQRWIIVVAAIIVQMCLGAVYAFSVLVPPLEAEFHWTRIETSPAFTIALLVFALSMIPAGRLQDRKGPAIVATLGGILLVAGMVLSSFTSSLMWFYVSYGVVGGLGLGLAYVTPIATCVKWFPDKKGLITGLAVFGFGAGSIVFSPLWTYLIGFFGWRNTFLATGILFALLVLPFAQLLKNPAQGFCPEGWKPPEKAKTARDYGPGRMLRTTAMFLLWASFWFGTTAGLMMIGAAKQATMELAVLDGVTASLAVSVLGFFNAFGRVIWGFSGDRFGREKILPLIFAICSGALFLIAFIHEPLIFVIGMFIVGLTFGGFLALYPAITADFYGTKNLGINYGIIFTAYGAGAVLGPLMAGYFKTFANSYVPAFYVAGSLAFVGIILALFVKRSSSRLK
jgi:OFA family oxalate/formate antiporter-like MFS transporter